MHEEITGQDPSYGEIKALAEEIKAGPLRELVPTVDLTPVLAELKVSPCWAARRGYGSFLTFDFGERLTRISRGRAREIGMIHLWIYSAEWALTVGESRVDLNSSFDEVDAALHLFVGSAVVGIELDPVVLRFEGPGHPSIFLAPMAEADSSDDMMKLYLPGHRVLKVSQSGGLAIQDDRAV